MESEIRSLAPVIAAQQDSLSSAPPLSPRIPWASFHCAQGMIPHLVFASLDQVLMPCCQCRRRLIPTQGAIGWPSRVRSTAVGGLPLMGVLGRSRDQIRRGGFCQHVAC